MVLAQLRMRQLSEYLATAGLHIDSTQLERLPSQLQRWYRKMSNKQPFRQILAQLQAFATLPPSQKQTIMAELQELVAESSPRAQKATEPLPLALAPPRGTPSRNAPLAPCHLHLASWTLLLAPCHHTKGQRAVLFWLTALTGEHFGG